MIDYTDNQPIRTVQFPSNFQLSAARANAVRAIVARNVGDPARVSAEGRADADPIAPNTTAEGREQNRRIEIVLHRDAGLIAKGLCPLDPQQRRSLCNPSVVGPGAEPRSYRSYPMILRWCISFIGTALLAGLAWFFAPLLPAFEDSLPRLAIIVALLLAWGGANALLDIRRRRRDAALTRGIAASSQEETEEAQALQARLTAALDLLKKSLRSRGYLYEQPWYAIIGPPGAGKTTALLNAGLRFPLAEQMGQGAVAGVGGTRLCDWWFTEDAVLIDTAGRYTTQDFERGGRSRRLGRLPRPAEADQAAAAAERPAGGVPAQRHRPGAGGRTRGACGGDPWPDQGAADAVRRADAGLYAVHQGGPDRRLHRVLRRPRPRAAGAGMGHDVRPGAA